MALSILTFSLRLRTAGTLQRFCGPNGRAEKHGCTVMSVGGPRLKGGQLKFGMMGDSLSWIGFELHWFFKLEQSPTSLLPGWNGWGLYCWSGSRMVFGLLKLHYGIFNSPKKDKISQAFIPPPNLFPHKHHESWVVQQLFPKPIGWESEVEYCSEYYKNPIYGHLHEAMRANFQEFLGGIDAVPRFVVFLGRDFLVDVWS